MADQCDRHPVKTDLKQWAGSGVAGLAVVNCLPRPPAVRHTTSSCRGIARLSPASSPRQRRQSGLTAMHPALCQVFMADAWAACSPLAGASCAENTLSAACAARAPPVATALQFGRYAVQPCPPCLPASRARSSPRPCPARCRPPQTRSRPTCAPLSRTY